MSDKQDVILPYDNKKAHITNNKIVEQFNLTGEKIGEFYSAKEAADALGMKKGGNSAILRVCRGQQKTCMGYIWKFKDKGNG